MEVRTCPSCREYKYMTKDGICRECASESIPSKEFTRALRGMCAMVSLGMSVEESMHMVSTEDERYGEIADRFERVIDKTSNDTELHEALERSSGETDSEELADFYDELADAIQKGKENAHGFLLTKAKKRISG